MNIYTVRGRGKGREAQAMSKAKRRVGRELTVNYRGFPMGVNQFYEVPYIFKYLGVLSVLYCWTDEDERKDLRI